MQMRRCCVIAWLLTAGALLLRVATPADAAPLKNVLVLAEGPTLPYGLLMRQRTVEAMRPDSAEPLNVYEELIDSVRFQSEDYDRQLVALYRAKYGTVNLSLVVTITEPALDFALRHRDELFPNVPIVFGAVDDRALRGRTLGPNITGLFSHRDAQETVRLALTLHPAVRHLVVIGGTSRFDRGLIDAIRPDLHAFESRVSVTYLVGKPLREVLRDVAALRDDALVFFVSMARDGDGTARTGPEVLEALRPATAVPIYGGSKNFLGHGIVGGFVHDYEQQGTELGRRAREILDGVPLADVPLTRAHNPLLFDWHELKRFGIDEAQLPAGATVLNRQPSLWDTHKRTVLMAGAALAGQFLLIGGLLVQHRRRRRAELALHNLSGRLLSAQEDERRRIARELHDNVSQQMALLANGIDEVAMNPGGPPAVVARSMHELRERTAEISSEIHNLSHRLHSSKLEMLGLVPAVRGHCQELLAQGVQAHFRHENVPPSLSHDVALCLFRIVQEGLNNVVKHSGVREAAVTLRGTRDGLLLVVADSGRGFDEKRVAEASLGLLSMRERLRLIGGEFTMSSQPGQGTTIVARVPLP
jgi:signal transduction histidine kinase